jgi:hypothetical protein
MPQKTLGTLLLVAGIVLILVSLLADVIGIGGKPGIGLKQVCGAAAGIVIAIIGMIMKNRAAGTPQ